MVEQVAGEIPADSETILLPSADAEGSLHLMPNGVPVFYQWAPKRKYFLSPFTWAAIADGGVQHDAPGWYEVPSISTVVDLLEKGGLSHWGQKIGAQGVLTLFNTGAIFPVSLPGRDRPVLAAPGEGGAARVIGTTETIELLEAFLLDIRHTKDTAADRGEGVHKALELWAKEGFKPEPAMYPEEEQGYVEALRKFLDDVPSFEPVGCEVVVASIEHGFAGRYDLRARTHAEHEVVHRVTATRAEHRSVLAPSLILFDLKTSKDVYESHLRQAEGYEIASVESGYEPTDGRGILNVNQDGKYQLVPSHAVAESFLTTLADYNESKAMAARKKALGGARGKGWAR